MKAIGFRTLVTGFAVGLSIGWMPSAIAAQDRLVAFIGTMNDDDDAQVFLRDTSGIKQTAQTGAVRELQSLSHDLVAIETINPVGRRFEILNIVTGERKVVYRPGEFEGFPLFSNDGTKMLVVANRMDRYEIETSMLTAPYGVEHIVSSKTYLSPRAWPCSGGFLYFLDLDAEKIIRLDFTRKTLEDITPPDLTMVGSAWVSASCDERTLAVSFFGSGRFSRLLIYRDDKVVYSVDNAIEPNVSEDGSMVVFLDGYLSPTESETPAQRIMQYDIGANQLTELIGPTGFFGVPVFME